MSDLHYKHQRDALWQVQRLGNGTREYVTSNQLAQVLELPRSSLLGRMKTLVRFGYLERKRGGGGKPDSFRLTEKAVGFLAEES